MDFITWLLLGFVPIVILYTLMYLNYKKLDLFHFFWGIMVVCTGPLSVIVCIVIGSIEFSDCFSIQRKRK